MYQAHYRLSMLAQLHQLAAHNVLNNHAQLHLTVSNILMNVLLVLVNFQDIQTLLHFEIFLLG